jgi:polar amino acid transport system substrate-binding protein
MRACLVLLALCLGACDLPRDPEGTLERARGGTLRAGAAEAAPWVVRRGSGGRPAGPEAALVEEFARSIDARVEWQWASGDELLRRLEKRELDVVVSGLTAKSPWKAHVALTRPWRKDGDVERVIAVAAGENATLVALDRFIEGRLEGAP